MTDLVGTINVGETSAPITVGAGETTLIFFVPEGEPAFSGDILLKPSGATVTGALPFEGRWINIAAIVSEGDEVSVRSLSGYDASNNAATELKFFLRTV